MTKGVVIGATYVRQIVASIFLTMDFEAICELFIWSGPTNALGNHILRKQGHKLQDADMEHYVDLSPYVVKIHDDNKSTCS